MNNLASRVLVVLVGKRLEGVQRRIAEELSPSRLA